jgi:hypothetical protein
MSVVGRSLSTAIGDNGELISALAENLPLALPPFLILPPLGEGTENGMYRVARDTTNQPTRLRSYGAGARALFTTATCERKPTGDLIPILALLPDQEKSSRPLKATLIEGAVDPVLVYHPASSIYDLYYWVNAWSPPKAGALPFPTPLFPSTLPLEPTAIDSDYESNSSYSFPQPPSKTFTAIREPPDWFKPGTFTNDRIKTPDGNVGPFDIERFWVAPFTDAHLFRFPADFDPTPPPPLAPPVSLSPPLPPSPPPIGGGPSSDLLNSFPFAKYPQTGTTQQVNDAIYAVKHDQPLKETQKATYEEYVYAPYRIALLSRCTRVLMKTRGFQVSGRRFYDLDLTDQTTNPPKAADNVPSSLCHAYLVVEPPKPVWALPRGINKVVVQRPKWISYLPDGRIFITAALTYRYPAAGTVSLCAGNPQVDFTVHSPSDFWDYNRRAGILPESDAPQRAPFTPEKDLTFPLILDFTLVGLLNQMSLW